MRFNLTDLRLFRAVVDAGSIIHGAAEVGLLIPSASERLRDMRAENGDDRYCQHHRPEATAN